MTYLVDGFFLSVFSQLLGALLPELFVYCSDACGDNLLPMLTFVPLWTERRSDFSVRDDQILFDRFLQVLVSAALPGVTCPRLFDVRTFV